MPVDYRRPRVWIPAVLGFLLVLIVVLRVIQASTPGDAVPTIEEIRAERGVPVTVMAAERGAMSIWSEFNGTVSGTQEGVVRARSGDQIVSVPVRVGQAVRRGAVLVRQAGEATAARVRQAEAARQQAGRTVERLRPLHEAGAISDQEWEGALTQLELATADVAAASDILTLTSPLTGTVTEVLARPGMIPSPGDPLVRVADLSQLVVYLRVGASDASAIRAGQRARLTRGTAEGRVSRVALQADPATRLVEVEVAFPPGGGLIPGTLAGVEIEVAEREDAVTVPRAAVRDGHVWLVEEERATRRPVRVGLENRERAEILSGIDPGDRVVVEGGSLLSEGARVRIVNASEG